MAIFQAQCTCGPATGPNNTQPSLPASQGRSRQFGPRRRQTTSTTGPRPCLALSKTVSTPTPAATRRSASTTVPSKEPARPFPHWTIWTGWREWARPPAAGPIQPPIIQVLSDRQERNKAMLPVQLSWSRQRRSSQGRWRTWRS